MILQNKYVIGCLIMFYEIEMVHEYVMSILGMLDGVENPEDVTIHVCWNEQEYLETIDQSQVSVDYMRSKLYDEFNQLKSRGCKLEIITKTNSDSFYNIAQYRRDLNYNWCERVDFVIWGETDSMFPREGLHVIETVSSYVKSQDIHRYVINFADRKNWDSSWDVITHPMFESVKYVDEKDWLITNEASSKSYMTMERMNEINAQSTDIDVRLLTTPKFDGSCLVISSDLIKAGVNIPHAITHCGEDTSFGEMAKVIMGSYYRQFCVKNILRVHNRRHPRKRMYIAGENNPMGFVGMDKGMWWDILEGTSKSNLQILHNSQKSFHTIGAMLNTILSVRG